MALSQSSVSWRGLTFAGPSQAGSYQLRDITGWEEWPAYSTQKVAVGSGHGNLVAPIRFDERVVTVTGWCISATARDALLVAFQSGLALGSDTTVTESLTVTHAGRTLSADARPVHLDTKPEAGWANGRFGWIAQWLCSDPLRYGPSVTQQSFLALPGTGLALPTTLPAAIPDNPVGGLFSVTNDGTADAPASFVLTGPLDQPGVLLNGGTAWQKLVQYGFSLPDGSSLVINTSDGGAGFVNGAYRSPMAGSNLTSDLVIRPGVNTVQALGVASTGSPGSSISVTFRPAYW